MSYWRSLKHRAADVRGLRVWITGASSGIGAELALLLANQGNHVVISARSTEKLEALRARCSQQVAQRIDCIACDVSNESDMRAAAATLERSGDAIDVLVINAGICEYIDVADADKQEAVDTAAMRRVFDVNFYGAVHAVNAALPLLRKSTLRKSHSAPLIVGVSSLSTYTAFARAQAYGASKAAMRYFLEAMRIDLAREGIDVTIVSPGFVDTPLTAQNDFPMPTMINVQQAAQEIAGAIASHALEHAFPARLVGVLRLARALPSVWYRVVAPKLERAQESAARDIE